METNLNLIIGQGIGPAEFGMTIEEITELFGEPDETDNDTEDGTTTLFYDDILTDFVFEKNEDDDTLRLSSILTSNTDYAIDNKIHFGDSEEAVVKFAKTLKAAQPEIEVDDSTKERYLYFDDLNMVAIFSNGGLSSVQIGAWDESEESEE